MPLETRRVPVGGRRRLVSAPAGDPFLARYSGSRGENLAGFGAFCRENLPRDAVMLDIGANIGLTTLVAAEHIPDGRILAVEASPGNCRALRANLARHGIGIATVCESAVGDQAGEVGFFDNSAYGHVVTGGHVVGLPATVRPVTTVDALVAEHGLDRVDFIKVDVEGYEQAVLTGARATMERFGPIVFLEFNSVCMIACFNRNPREFLDWLLARFDRLFLWRGRRLVDLREMGVLAFLLEHLARHGGNDDLVIAGAGRVLRTRDAADREAVGGPARLLARLGGLWQRPKPASS